LDTKLKNNEDKNYWQIGMTFVILLVLIANWVSSNYWSARIRAFNEQINIFETDLYYEKLGQISYDLYWQLLERHADHQEAILDQLVDIHGTIDESTYWEFFASQLDNISYWDLSATQLADLTQQYVYDLVVAQLQSFQQLHQVDFQNIDYAVAYQSGEQVLLSGHERLRLLATGASSFQDLTHNYHHLMMISYDEFGKQTVYANYNQTEFLINQNPIWSSSELFSWKPITDTVFVFALPFNLIFTDQISEYQNANFMVAFVEIIRGISFIAVGIVSVLALLLPVQSLKKFMTFKWFLNGSLEFVVILGVVVLGIIFGMMPHVANGINHYSLTVQINFLVRLVVRLINTSIWVILLSVITLIILYLKHFIFNRKPLYSLELIKQTDFKDPLTIKIISLLGIQLIAISFMCLAGVYGVVMALVYSICLFWLLKKYLTKAQQDYRHILEIITYLSNQKARSLTAADEDLGLFNSMKERLNTLQLDLYNLKEAATKNKIDKGDLHALFHEL